MKSYLKKFFIYLVSALLILSCFCCTSIEASTAQTYAYYSNNFQFSGTSNSLMKNYDGNYMGIEAKATSSSGASHDVKIHVYLYNRGTVETYTFPSNGSTYKFDYIYLGSAASSDVGLVFECNSSDTITLEMISYSWYT